MSPFKSFFLIFSVLFFIPALLSSQSVQTDSRDAKQERLVFQNHAPVLFLSQSGFFEKEQRAKRTNNDFVFQKFRVNTTMFEPVNGPVGGTVRSIAVDSGGWLFIATDGEVYRSTDNGLHWNMNLFPSQLHNFVEPVTVLGPTVIVAETDFSDFISTDRGDSWSFINDDVQGFAVDTNGVIYAGSNYGGVKKSSDAAKSWSSFALQGKKIWKVVLCGNGRFACPSDSGTYFSADTGKSWIYRPYETPFTWNLVSDRRGRLFVLRYYGFDFQLYRSTDFGESWQRIILPVQEDAWRIYVQKDGKVLVTTDKRILTTTDGGTVWEQLDFPIGTPLTVGNDIQGNLLAGSFYGIYRRNDTSKEWQEINDGIHARRIEQILFTPAGSILVLSLGNWFRSTDGGITWSTVKFDTSIVISLSAYSPAFSSKSGNIFVAAAFHNECGFLRSTDDGISWKKISVLSNYYFFYGLIESSTGELYAVDGYNNIFTSSDGGDSWRKILLGTHYVGPIAPGIAADNFGNCYLAKDSSVLLLNMGAVQKVNPLKRKFASWESMSINTQGEIFLGSSSNGVYHSTDTGSTWSLFNTGLFNTYIMSTAADDSGNVVLGTSTGVFRLADSVDSWNQFNDGFPSTFTTSLAISPQGYLFAGTQGFGMYKTIATLGKRIQKFAPPLPSVTTINDFWFSQNYPNPFNNQTIVRYDVPVHSRVEIKIYDIIGRMVAVLLAQEIAQGKYEAIWTPQQQASGVYFCEMRASSSSTTYRKIIKLLYLR